MSARMFVCFFEILQGLTRAAKSVFSISFKYSTKPTSGNWRDCTSASRFRKNDAASDRKTRSWAYGRLTVDVLGLHTSARCLGELRFQSRPKSLRIETNKSLVFRCGLLRPALNSISSLRDIRPLHAFTSNCSFGFFRAG